MKARATVSYTHLDVYKRQGLLPPNDLVWEMTDMFNNLMVIPNAIGLFALTSVVVASTHGVGVKK